MALFCGGHHDLLHEGGFTVTGGANGELRFRSRYGLTLEPSPPLGPATVSDLSEANAAAGPEITEKTNLCGTGERMNLGYCVDAVVAACRDG